MADRILTSSRLHQGRSCCLLNFVICWRNMSLGVVYVPRRTSMLWLSYVAAHQLCSKQTSSAPGQAPSSIRLPDLQRLINMCEPGTLKLSLEDNFQRAYETLLVLKRTMTNDINEVTHFTDFAPLYITNRSKIPNRVHRNAFSRPQSVATSSLKRTGERLMVV